MCLTVSPGQLHYSSAITLTFLVDHVIDVAPILLALDADTSPNILWLSQILAWVVPTIIIDLPAVVWRWGAVNLDAVSIDEAGGAPHQIRAR